MFLIDDLLEVANDHFDVLGGGGDLAATEGSSARGRCRRRLKQMCRAGLRRRRGQCGTGTSVRRGGRYHAGTMGSPPERRRPHYCLAQRYRILRIRSLLRLSAAETARRFRVSSDTILRWERDVDLAHSDDCDNRAAKLVRMSYRNVVATPFFVLVNVLLFGSIATRFLFRIHRTTPKGKEQYRKIQSAGRKKARSLGPGV